jgi:hypothetical protein
MALKSVTTPAGAQRFALHCDHCDRPIVDAAQGSTVWAEGEGEAPALVVHKGDCQRAIAATLGVDANGLGFDELAYLPTRLEGALRIDHEKASASAAFLDRLRAIGGPAA